MGKIFCIMGKSSSGKDTIFKKLHKRFPDIKMITMYTTRPIREGETEGVEYYFVDEAVLADMEKDGKVIELREYNTKCGIWKYFTANDGQIDLENHSYFVIGTLQSYEAMRKYFGKDKIKGIYLEVESGERLQRALNREKMQNEPKYAEMCRRYLADEEDFSEEKLKQSEIEIRFSNEDSVSCMKNIAEYINEMM